MSISKYPIPNLIMVHKVVVVRFLTEKHGCKKEVEHKIPALEAIEEAVQSLLLSEIRWWLPYLLDLRSFGSKDYL